MTNFDSCDFYDCDPDAEQLDFSDPEEALDAIVEAPVERWIAENAPVTVYGWRKVEFIDGGWDCGCSVAQREYSAEELRELFKDELEEEGR